MQLVCTLLFAAITLTSCGKDEGPITNDPITPNTEVPDPTGTIRLSMRDRDNGRTYLDNIYIDTENFEGAKFASIGAVRGLGNITNIPTTGWASEVAVVPGNGYVAYANDKFYRMYVVNYILNTSNGIIGADVKYQEPFKGKDEEIQLETNSLTFPASGGTQTITFKNSGIIPFKVETVVPEWCSVQKTSTYNESFLANGITITVKPNNSINTTEGSVKITTLHGKSSTIKIIRSGEKPVFNVDINNIGFDKNSNYRTVTINTTLNDWEAESSEEWCTFSRNGNNLTIRVTATDIDRKAIVSFKGTDTKITIHQSKYVVGDTYNEDGISGTVGYIGDDKRFIYSEKLGDTQWSTEDVLTGADSKTDGEYNMNIIKKIPSWQELYPAFYLCDKLNTNGVTGWYLPAVYEITKINTGSDFWCSTEYSSTEAYPQDRISIPAYPGYKYVSSSKDDIKSVYAFRKF